MRQTAEDDMDAEAANAARSTLTGIHRRIEDILYNANLAIDGKMPHDKLIKINNIIQELEKSAINLGAAVSEEDNTDTQ